MVRRGPQMCGPGTRERRARVGEQQTLDEVGVAQPAGGQEPRFEALLGELERLVEGLERGDQPLEEALTAFERGTALAKQAGAILDRAEARVSKILETRDGGLTEVPFDPERE